MIHYCPWCGMLFSEGLTLPIPLNNSKQCKFCHNMCTKSYCGKDWIFFLLFIFISMGFFTQVRYNLICFIPAVLFLFLFILIYTYAPYVRSENGSLLPYNPDKFSKITCNIQWLSFKQSKLLCPYWLINNYHTFIVVLQLESGEKKKHSVILCEMKRKKRHIQGQLFFINRTEIPVQCIKSIDLYKGDRKVAIGTII